MALPEVVEKRRQKVKNDQKSERRESGRDLKRLQGRKLFTDIRAGVESTSKEKLSKAEKTERLKEDVDFLLDEGASKKEVKKKAAIKALKKKKEQRQ